MKSKPTRLRPAVEGTGWGAVLAQKAAAGADAGEIADAVVAAWREIDAVLSPVIGPRAVAAVYHRSLFLAAREHAWLAGSADGLVAALDCAPLRAALAAQDSAAAAQAGAAHLHSFRSVLGGLIGTALCERLLDAAWARCSAGALPGPNTDAPGA